MITQSIENIINNINFSEIKKSQIHGMGLFSTENILKEQVIGFLDGQIIKWNELKEIEKNLKNISGKDQAHQFFYEWNALTKDTLLVRPIRTKYSYINHSRNPNLEIKYNPIRVIAIKDITKGDELFLDYRKEDLNIEYINGHGASYL